MLHPSDVAPLPRKIRVGRAAGCGLVMMPLGPDRWQVERVCARAGVRGRVCLRSRSTSRPRLPLVAGTYFLPHIEAMLSFAAVAMSFAIKGEACLAPRPSVRKQGGGVEREGTR